MVAVVDYPVLYQREMGFFSSCLVLTSDKAFFA